MSAKGPHSALSIRRFLCLTTLLIAGLALSIAPPLFAQVVTPTPVLSYSYNACVVALSWDVTSIQGADRIRWEATKDNDFTVPDRNDPAALGRGVVRSTVGSVDIDLREFGPVLDGTRYYLRVGARGPAMTVGALRSESVVFYLDMRTPDTSVVPGSVAGEFEIGWFVEQAVALCADRIAWEVRRQPSGAGSPVLSGETPLSGVKGSATVQIPNARPGKNYYIQLAAYYESTNEEDRIGRRGHDYTVTIEGEGYDVAVPVAPAQAAPLGLQPEAPSVAPAPEIAMKTADLEVIVSQNRPSVWLGQRMTYTVAVENLGMVNTVDVVLEGTRSEGFEYVSTTATHRFDCRRTGATVRCWGGAIPRGETATITIVTEFRSHPSSLEGFQFRARVDPENRISESNENNNLGIATARTVRLVDHAINGRRRVSDASDYAESLGYENSFVLRTGLACQFRRIDGVTHAMEVMSSVESPDPLNPNRGTGPTPRTVCAFTRLGGKLLNPPWKFGDVHVVVGWGNPFAICVVESINQDGGGIVIRMRHAARTSYSARQEHCFIDSLHLIGPEGRPWEDAFN